MVDERDDRYQALTQVAHNPQKLSHVDVARVEIGNEETNVDASQTNCAYQLQNVDGYELEGQSPLNLVFFILLGVPR